MLENDNFEQLNQTNENESNDAEILEIVISYIAIGVLILGIVGNSLTLLFFKTCKHMRHEASVVYLAFILVFETLSLFSWNLRFFLKPNFNVDLYYYNLFTCKLFGFLHYFTLQLIGLLMIMLCLDRCMSVLPLPDSIAEQLPFSTTRFARIWCVFILVIVALTNIHILIFNGSFDSSVINRVYYNRSDFSLNRSEYFKAEINAVNCFYYAPDIRILPIWDVVTIVLYTFAPFIFILILNCVLLKYTIYLGRYFNSIDVDHKETKLLQKKRRFNISVMIVSLMFVLMTSPASLAYLAYFTNLVDETSGDDNGGGGGIGSASVMSILHCLSYFNHSNLFLTLFLSNDKFRKYCCRCVSLVKKKKSMKILHSDNEHLSTV